MQTYHKHGMGESITLSFPITNNGVGITGQTPVAAVRKKSNGQWLDDAKTAFQAGYNDIAMSELDAANLPGAYTLDITHIDITSEEYQVYFKNTGTYAGMDFESHIFTGAVYVPASSSYATGTIRGALDIMRNKDINRTFAQATDSLEAQKDAAVVNEANITDIRDEALGKWVLDPALKTLTLYRVDGVTVLKTFNLTDTTDTVPVFIGRTPV